jgi:hypothetical protein
VNTVIKLRVPKNFGKFLSRCATGGFSSSLQLHGVSRSTALSEISLYLGEPDFNLDYGM